MMLLEWIAVASGLWLGATRVRDSRVAGLMAVLVTAHLGLMMLLGNPRPNEILVLDSRRSRQSFSKSAYYDAGAPVAIIILFLRLFNPQFFEGKLSKWWPLAVILLSGRPILFICRLSINVYDCLIFAAYLIVLLALCAMLWILIASFWREICDSSPLFQSSHSNLAANTSSTASSPLGPIPGRFLMTPTSAKPPSSVALAPPNASHYGEVQRSIWGPREEQSRPSTASSTQTSHSIQLQSHPRDEVQRHANSRGGPVNTVRMRDSRTHSRRAPVVSNALDVKVSKKNRRKLYQAHVRTEDEELNARRPQHDFDVTPAAAAVLNGNVKTSPTHVLHTAFASWHLSTNNRYVTSLEAVEPRLKIEDQNEIAEQRKLEENRKVDESAWRRIATEELRSIDALLPSFQHKLLILQEEPKKRYIDGVNQCKDLWLDVGEKAIAPLSELSFAEEDPLAPYCHIVLDEMVLIFAESQRLMSIPPVEAQRDDAKALKTPVVPQSAMLVDNDDSRPHQGSEASKHLEELGSELKKHWDRTRKTLRIMHNPPKEPQRLSMLMGRCYTTIDFANDALQQLRDLSLYVDGNLEETRKGFVDTAKRTIAICEYLTKDDAGRPYLPPPDDVLPTVTNQPEDQADKLAVLMQDVRKECLLWKTDSGRQPAGNMKLRVKWACKWILQGSELVDKLSDTADEDLRRLPHTLFNLVVPMIRDIMCCLRHSEADHLEITNTGLPHAKNINIQLDILERRKIIVERRQESRRVGFVNNTAL